jgi:small subunit ribosomal protein S4e
MVRKLKALSAPDFWHVEKKRQKWVVSPSPGPHKKFECIPLSLILKNILKIAETTKEAKTIIKGGNVLVDGRVVKDPSYPVGLFDTLALPKIKKFYRIVPTKKGLELVEIDEKESNLKICRINNKTILKGGRIQLNLNDGKNILTENKEYKTGDSLLISLPSLNIVKHLKLQPNAIGVVVKGIDAGKIWTVEKIVSGSMTQPPRLLCRQGEETKEILKERFFVVGEDKPLITVNKG